MNEMKFIGIRYIKDITYEPIPDAKDFDVEQDQDDFGDIIHITEYNSLRPRIYPVGCVALFKSETGTNIVSYSICGKSDIDHFSRETAKEVAKQRAEKINETDIEYLKSLLGDKVDKEILEGICGERTLFLTTSDIMMFPSHLRRNVIIAEYDLFKDIDMANARAEDILPKINRN